MRGEFSSIGLRAGLQSKSLIGELKSRDVDVLNWYQPVLTRRTRGCVFGCGWGCYYFQLLTVAQGSAELGFAFSFLSVVVDCEFSFG